MSNSICIGIGTVATCGKDTLFKCLSHILEGKRVLERCALADMLKAEVNQFCLQRYGISAFTKDSVQKEIIRDLFIAHGTVMRKLTKGRHWTDLLQPRIDECIKNGSVPVCTDIRFAQFDADELHWLKVVNKGVYIHINRMDKNGIKIPPLNLDEAENEPKLERAADYKLCWPTSDNFEFLCEIVKVQLGDLIKKIEESV